MNNMIMWSVGLFAFCYLGIPLLKLAWILLQMCFYIPLIAIDLFIALFIAPIMILCGKSKQADRLSAFFSKPIDKFNADNKTVVQAKNKPITQEELLFTLAAVGSLTADKIIAGMKERR